MPKSLSAPDRRSEPSADIAPAPTPSAASVSPPAVELHALVKRFARRRSFGAVLRRAPRELVAAVDGVTLRVDAGSVFGLLGANGAGKTTIFKMLATTVTPDGGRASVAGCDVAEQPTDVRRIVSTVPADERSLNWRLSARENLRLFATLYGLRGAEAHRRIDEMLHVVGLDATGSKLVAAFSSGMRQRLLIARALLARPQVLLLDEPTRALDPISAVELRRFLRQELVHRQGCTLLVATHNADEAFTFCDRVAILDHGRVLATGPAPELATRFAEPRYRASTLQPSHDIWSALERRRVIRSRVVAGAVDGWTQLEFAMDGGQTAAASLLRELLTSGLDVSALEPVTPTLADLLARVVRASQEAPANA